MSNKWTPNKSNKNNVEQVDPQTVEKKLFAKSYLHKHRRTHRRAVAVAVAAVVAAVAAVALVTAAAPRHHRLPVCASEFVEVKY